jgi:signal transduction histidine kinase/ActR/RegA family two-component response regulator
MRRFPEAGSVRNKLVAMAVATTFVAMVAAMLSMLAYDLLSFRSSWVDDISTQAELVGSASAAALNFNDAKAASQNLAMLRVRPQIQVGAIYDAKGRRFASYRQPDLAQPEYPEAPGRAGYSIDGGELSVVHPIIENGELLGTVYIRETFPLVDRLKDYSMILALVMLGSLLLAAAVASRLQVAITRPLGAVTEVAHEVMLNRDFSLRVERRDGGEIGMLVDAFNGMLTEIGRRALALQETNSKLEREMQVRQCAEDALMRADRRKDEFLATLAHELRNPLAPIRTGLDILRIKEGDKVAGARARAIMERQLKQMVRLVDDLLDVSRINTGKLTINAGPVQLQAVVSNALEIVRPHIDQLGHRLQVDLPQAVTVMGDATRLAQILSNLLNNAAKYTPPGGAIRLSGVVADGQVRIHVADNGIGIASDMLDDIFQMFSQADSSLERANAGLGVGLSLARRLAELHGGAIEAHSAGIGQGSEFILQLPVLPVPVQPEPQAAAPLPQGGPYRILLVDDNVDFVTSIGALLDLEGHQVLIRHDGAAALAAAARFHPQFAFLDIGLPHLNGYDLARALRRLPAYKHTIMIAVTGWGQEKDRQLALDAGFDGHLVKPVAFDDINAVLAGQGTSTAFA